MQVTDPGHAPGRVVEHHLGGHAVRADLGAVLDRVGNVGHQRRCLGVDLAALQAIAAVDAVRTVAERAVGDADRPDAHLDAELAGAVARGVGAAGDRMRRVRVAVRVAPRPEVAGHRQFELEALVVALEVGVADRPVLPHPVATADLEVGGMKSRAVAGVVDHRAADPVPAVVLAELDRIRAAGDAVVGPVEPVRSGFVGDPVLVGIPERAGLEHHDLPAASRQPLSERAAAGARADDHEVDRERVVVARHPLARHRAAVDVEQERRVVVGRPQRAAQQRAQLVPAAHVPRTPRCSVSLTGSRSNAGAPSQLSRWPTPSRAYPRG